MATDLDVGALRLLQAIRDAGSLTAAAGVLGVSQPAVSQHVRRLEERLGTPLVTRSGRTVRLTEAGQVLARHGEAVTAALQAAQAEIASLTGLESGLVRLAAFPSASAVLVPRALALLRQRHPGVRVTLEEVEPPESIGLVRAGHADIALAFSYPGETPDDDLDGLEVSELLTDQMRLVVPSDHPLAAQGTIGLADASNERWIAGCPRCRSHLMASARQAGFVPDITYSTDDHSAVLGLVGAGLGVSLMPGLIEDAARGREGVVLRPVSGVSPRLVHAATNPELAGVPAVGALLRALRDVVAG